MTDTMIPIGRIPFGDEEKKAISDCIDSGWIAPGDRTHEFEEQFAEYVGARHAIFVDSCTSALFLSLQYLKKMHRLPDTVTVPSLTFTATAEVLVHTGYAIAFGDVDKATYCLSEVTGGSLPTNIYGYRADHGALIYDSAHRIEKDDMKGSEALWCYSLYPTKNISVISGGIIATNDTDAYTWLCKARDHGLSADTKERYTGTYKQYDVEFIGWRMKADDVRAAIGIEQLKKLPLITERRNEIVALYNKGFDRDWKGNHVYGIFVENQEAFIDYMYSRGIQTTVHFRPLHTMTAYQSHYHGKPLPVTEFVGTHEVSLPLFPQLTDDQVTHIVTTAKESGMVRNE